MEFKDLKHGDRIEMFWHFNSTSGDHIWESGKVYTISPGVKLFWPDNSKVKVRILPHRMDEVKRIQL